MKDNLLEIGKIVATRGIKGEVRVQYLCDSAEILCEFDSLYLDGEVVEVENSFPQKNIVVMKLKGYNTPEESQKLIGKTLFVERDDFELDEDTFFIKDIIGLNVVDIDNDRVYGVVEDVLQNGGADVYVVKTANNKQILLPALKEVVIETDLAKKQMLVRPLKGLIEVYLDED